MSNKKFGETFISFRLSANLSLRRFCDEMASRGFNLNSGNWSRIERGLSSPPVNKNFYDAVANLFDLSDKEGAELRSLAQAVKIIPKSLQETELMEHMPVMLRKIDGQPLENEEIENLVDWIKETVEEEQGE